MRGLQAHRPAARGDRRGAELPAAVPRRRAVRRLLQPHRRHARGQLRRGARHGAAEPARGGAAHLPRRAARVGEALFGVTIQIKEGTALGRVAYRAAIGHRHKASAYEIEGKPVPALPARGARDRRLAGAQEHPCAPGPQPHPLGRHRRGADLARSHPLVLGDGRQDVRGLRPDRERGARHRQLSGPHQDRHHRPPRRPAPSSSSRPQGEILLRGPAHLHGLPQQAGEDGRGPARRLAAHGRRRRHRQPGLRAHHRPHEGHHHHRRRQEHHAVARSRTSSSSRPTSPTPS